MKRIGIMGGSGLYQLEGLQVREETAVQTPFGDPSDRYLLAEYQGREVVFLPRHGKKHRRNPSEINYRANIYGMKQLGVEWLVSVTACGSLRKELKPLEFVIPTQFVDRTNHARPHTFFENGIVVHVGFSDPVCETLARAVEQAARAAGVTVHYGGTYLNMEGPQFSTRAESLLYRSWGMDVIGMTNMTEARLAREAEICYASLAAVTDYDCWYETEEAVSADAVIANLLKNAENSKKIIKKLIPAVSSSRECACQEALGQAIVTRPEAVPDGVKQKLGIFLNKYFK
ncbi:MAG: S-methyl-5'-thioadenosine phosphorylase [Candidatus Omnitrophica bacterium]|nr:S-methyl-5'-thioadenosine phosphorylase [Candidatus Omnitrophota bacterium]